MMYMIAGIRHGLSWLLYALLQVIAATLALFAGFDQSRVLLQQLDVASVC